MYVKIVPLDVIYFIVSRTVWKILYFASFQENQVCACRDVRSTDSRGVVVSTDEDCRVLLVQPTFDIR